MPALANAPSGMAEVSTPGPALSASPQPQPYRLPPRRASSLATPPKSRFSPAHDSISLLSPPPKQGTPSPKNAHAESPGSRRSGSPDHLRRCRSEAVNWGADVNAKLVVPPPPAPAPAPPPPAPPPLPSAAAGKKPWRAPSSTVQDPCPSGGSFVSQCTLNAWDRVFFDGANADVAVCSQDGRRIHVLSTVLRASSPVLQSWLQKPHRKSRPRVLRMFGVPFHAVRCFLRYLYSSRCERSDMEEHALHLLVLAHTYMVPSLKRLCTIHFEQGQLNVDNVVDILQIARLCDAPRLHLLCVRRIVWDFKAVVRSDGWKAMKRSDPALEQELIEAVIRASMKKQDKLTKLEDDQVYAQLYDATEALTHICRDGCRSIGSAGKTLTSRPTTPATTATTICSYPACNKMESLVRHFADCKLKVAGGCVRCKRMWQLLELHSRMCSAGDSCKVPLCRWFKDSVGQQSSLKIELRWKMLVLRVTLAKRAVEALSVVAAVTKQLDRAM